MDRQKKSLCRNDGPILTEHVEQEENEFPDSGFSQVTFT